MGGRSKAISLVGLLFISLTVGGVAAAAPNNQPQDPNAEIISLESSKSGHQEKLAQRVKQISEVGSELKQSQGQLDEIKGRAEELGRRTGALEKGVEAQQRTADASKAAYQEKLKAAYRGEGVDELVGFINGVMGVQRQGSFSISAAGQVLSSQRESVQRYQTSQIELKNLVRQLDQKKREYDKARQEEKQRASELQRKDGELKQSVAQIGADIEKMDARLTQLQMQNIDQWSASAGGMGDSQRLNYELQVAREITVRPVTRLPAWRYEQLYRKAAEEYGFAGDWYILAAVGKIESNHGEDLGPSSAGALGPMQFLPSTWKTYGVDGNGDGVANIMDPEDAIPAAARYLVLGGAPKDWYQALYAYNHADWYVKDVLGIAEGYRQIAGDDRVGPYIR